MHSKVPNKMAEMHISTTIPTAIIAGVFSSESTFEGGGVDVISAIKNKLPHVNTTQTTYIKLWGRSCSMYT